MSNSGFFTDPSQVKMVVESLSNEKGLPQELIFVAMENALSSVMAKSLGGEPTVHVSIDRQSGAYTCYRVWQVLEDDAEITLPDVQIALSAAKAISELAAVGEEVKEILSFESGRILAHQSGQMIAKFVREAERMKLADQFQRRVGELFTGQVKRVTRDSIIIDLGDRIEGCMPRKEILPREIFRVGDRVRAYLFAVDPENKGPVLLFSRVHPMMLVELFKLEVPEMQEGVLEIKAVARDPGARAKIAVKTKDARIDAVGACVGMRGSRVQAVSTELNGERVDIVLWEDSPANLVISAMAPADIKSVIVDETEKVMDVVVDEESLSQAIGRGGQNVRLASQLVDWTINVVSEAEAQLKQKQAPVNPVEELCESLDIDEQLASVLIREGFESIDALGAVSVSKLAEVEEFDEDIAEELMQRAKSAILSEVIALSEDKSAPQPDQSLVGLENMPKLVAYRLAAEGILTADDLAELSVTELRHIKGLSEALAAELIMSARAPWFES